MSKPTVEIVQIEPLAVRPAEAARLIGVSPRKFAQMRSAGLLPVGYKLGSCLIFRVSDLKKWADWGFPSLEKFLVLVERAKNELG